jgi:hypothetical protein
VAIKGPKTEAEIRLEIGQYNKNLRVLSSMHKKTMEDMAGTTKKARRALQDKARVDKAHAAHNRLLIRQAKEKIIQLQREERATRKVAAATKQATHSFGTFSKALGTSITLWYTARTAIFAVQRALEGIVGIYVKGAEAIDDFRLSVIGTSAIMIPSIESGTTAAEKMAIAWQHNTEMMKRLEVVAARHIATGKAVRDVYEGMIIARVFPDEKDVENLAKLADFITLYTKGQRLEIQLMQEVRGLMDGQVRAQNKLAFTLDRILNGKLKEHIQLWRAAGRNAQGELVILQEITTLLGDIGVLQGEILGTAQTWKNTLATMAERILRDGTVGAYEDIVVLLRETTGFLFDIQTGYTWQSEAIKAILNEGWLRIKDVVRGFLGMEMRQLNETMENFLTNTLLWLTNAEATARNFGQTLRSIFNALWFTLKNIQTILETIILIRLPSWVLKIGMVLGSTLSISAALPVILASYAGIVLAGSRMLWNASRLEESIGDIDIATASLGEAIELGPVSALETANREAEGLRQKIKQSMKEAILMAVHGPVLAESLRNRLIQDMGLDIKFKGGGEGFDARVQALEEYIKLWKILSKQTDDFLKAEEKVAEKRRKAIEHRDRLLQAWTRETEKKSHKTISLMERGIAAVLREGEVLRVSKEEWDAYWKAIIDGAKAAAEAREETQKLILGEKGGFAKIIADLEERLTAENDIIKKFRDKDSADYKAHVEYKEQLERSLTRAKIDMYVAGAQTMVSAGAESLRLLAEQNKKWFKWYQGMAVAEILINTAVAIMRAFKDFPYPVALGISAALATLAGVQTAAVLAQEPPQELAEGGVSPTGFSALQGVYGRPTYMMAERQGKPEAVVPLDKYVISDKDDAGVGQTVNNIYIMAQDAKTFRDFARRNPSVFREQIIRAIQDNDKSVKSALKTAVR